MRWKPSIALAQDQSTSLCVLILWFRLAYSWSELFLPMHQGKLLLAKDRFRATRCKLAVHSSTLKLIISSSSRLLLAQRPSCLSLPHSAQTGRSLLHCPQQHTKWQIRPFLLLLASCCTRAACLSSCHFVLLLHKTSVPVFMPFCSSLHVKFSSLSLIALASSC